MDRLNFSTNWNGGKLNCNVFSTIRRHNPAVHYVGKIVEIYDQSTTPAKYRGKGEYLHVFPFKLHQLKPGMALLDTGYGVEETANIIRTMYKNKCADVNQETFAYCLIRKIKEKPHQGRLL